MQRTLNRALRTAALIGLLLGAGGCANLKLYDASQDTASTTMGQSFSALSFPEVSDQQTFLAQLASDEDGQVQKALLASRNSRVANALNKDSGQKDFRREIDARLTQILGWKTPIADPDLQRMSGMPEGLWVSAQALDAVNTDFAGQRDLFIATYVADQTAKGDTSKTPQFTCSATAAPPAAAPAIGDSGLYGAMVAACGSVQKVYATLKTVSVETLRASLGKGLLEEALSAIDADRKSEADNSALAKKIEADVRAASMLGATTEEVTKAFNTFKTDLGQASDVAKALGAKSVADTLDKWLALHLGNAAAGAADPPADVKQAQAALDLASALIGAAQGPPAVSAEAAQVALAGLQQRLDMAQLEKQRDRDRVQADQDRASALVREAADLATAELELARAGPGRTWFSDEAGAQALTAYAASWPAGRVPFELAEYHRIQIDRAYAAAKAAKTTQNWKALLQPAVARLQTSAKGGVKPEQGAAFAAGVVGAIVGAHN